MKRPSSRYRWELLALLFAAFFMNQGDRQAYNAVLPLIKSDLGLTDVQLGTVVTIFTILFAVLVPLAGFLGDWASKKWIVCLSLLTFSAGTLCTGFANGLLLLVAFRSIATGVGESFYVPAANTLIGSYHTSTRALAMAIHQTAQYVGVVASSWLAGWIGQRYGWRATFYIFGAFGVALAVVLAIRVRNEHADPELTSGDEAAPVSPPVPNPGDVLRGVVRVPTMCYLAAAYGCMVFVFIGYMTWMPTYMQEHFGLSLERAALHAVGLYFLFAFVGVMLGGKISDHVAVRRPAIRLEMEAIGLLLSVPFLWYVGAAHSLAGVYVALAGFGLFRGVFDSNLFAVPFDIIPARFISSATGLMICAAFIIGSTSPMILGYLKEHIDLSFGLSSLSAIHVLGALLVLVARIWFYAKDRLACEVPGRRAAAHPPVGH